MLFGPCSRCQVPRRAGPGDADSFSTACGPATLVAGIASRSLEWTGRAELTRRVHFVAPKVNRREAIGTMGLVGAAAAVSAASTADAGPGQPCRARSIRPTSGRPGADDGRPGHGGGAAVRAGPLRLRHSRGPEQRALGRLQGLRAAVLPGGPRGLGQRHGRRRGPGDGRGRRLRRGAGTRAHQRA